VWLVQVWICMQAGKQEGGGSSRSQIYHTFKVLGLATRVQMGGFSTIINRTLMRLQVVDCYSEPHLFVEVSELSPWSILRINQAAFTTMGMH
jgi:hypothetical protein